MKDTAVVKVYIPERNIEKMENIVTGAVKCVDEMNETLECIQEMLRQAYVCMDGLIEAGIVPPEDFERTKEYCGNILFTFDEERNYGDCVKAQLQEIVEKCKKQENICHILEGIPVIWDKTWKRYEEREWKLIKEDMKYLFKDISRIANNWCAQKWQGGRSNLYCPDDWWLEERIEEVETKICLVIRRLLDLEEIRRKELEWEKHVWADL